MSADDLPLADRLALLWSESLMGEMLRVQPEGIPSLSGDAVTRTLHEAHALAVACAGPTIVPETPEQREARHAEFDRQQNARIAKQDRDVAFGRTLARDLIAAGRAAWVWRDAIEGERDVYREGRAAREHVTLLPESRVHIRRDGALVCKATMRAETMHESTEYPAGRLICRSCAQRLATIGRDA